MALNITINGFAYRDSGSIGNLDIKYQMFFYRNGTASSPDKWNTVRTVENTGYFSSNLGDNDWLTQNGVVLSNSRVVVVFWNGSPLGDDRNATCSILNEWGASELTTDGSSVYTFNTQTKVNIIPDLSWSLPATGFVDTNYTAVNNSDDVHNWVFGPVVMNHWLSRYGQNINIINSINNTDYAWDDNSYSNNLPGASNGTHQWSVSGYYDVDIGIEDECGSVVSGTKQIQIFNHAPTAGITMVPANPLPDEVVTFQWSGTDTDNKITSIDWQISDSGIYGSTDTNFPGAGKSDIINHTNGLGTSWCGNVATVGAFTNPGTHNVSIVIHWWNGFTNQTLPYNRNFTQGVFSGPTVNFTQDPTQLPFGNEVVFENTSTNIDRVGKGLPGCTKYDWEFDDSGTITTETNKAYIDDFILTPTTINGVTTLTANWQDGWQNLTSSIQKSVVFATTVTIVPEDCYYTMSIIGTSSDGSISGYHWEVYKNATMSGTGLWDLIWTSPVDMDQQDKSICFTSVGYYDIIGYVHGTGTTTYDNEELMVSVVCPSESFAYVWNGTGVDDVGGDWTHTGSGVETIESMYSGTNGLEAVGLHSGNKIRFKKDWSVLDVSDYDLLVMRINIRSVSSGADMQIYLKNMLFPQGDTLNLSNYININSIDVWQKVVIPLEDFNMTSFLIPGDATFVNRVTLAPTGDMGIYLDDMVFSLGTVSTVYSAVPVCRPDVISDEIGEKAIHAKEMRPSIKSVRGFPGPINL